MRLKLSIILLFLVTASSTARAKIFDLNADLRAGITLNADLCKRLKKVPNLYKFGVSCLKEKNIISGLKEKAGVDLWFLPVKKIEVTLLSSITITKNLDGPFIFCGIWDF